MKKGLFGVIFDAFTESGEGTMSFLEKFFYLWVGVFYAFYYIFDTIFGAIIELGEEKWKNRNIS